MPLPLVQFSNTQEKSVYDKYYDLVTPAGSSIFKFPSETEVKSFFRLSKLPKNILEKIWDYVSQGSTIDKNTFNVGLRLIALAQTNFEPNLLGLNSNKCPAPRFSGHESILLLVGIDVTKIAWKLTTDEIGKYKSMFSPNVTDQYLSYVAYTLDDFGIKYFAQSGVKFVFLQHIWFLADYDQDMKLDFDEFCIAMHLIFNMLEGKYTSLPNCLPVELIPPSKRGGLDESLKKQAPASNATTCPKSISIESEFDWNIPTTLSSRYKSLWLSISLNKPTISNTCSMEISVHTQVAEPLCQISWSLVDVQRLGRINFEQFLVMMHIIDQIGKGQNPPLNLPADLADKFSKISLSAPSLYANPSNSYSLPSFPDIPVRIDSTQPSLQTSTNLMSKPPLMPIVHLEKPYIHLERKGESGLIAPSFSSNIPKMAPDNKLTPSMPRSSHSSLHSAFASNESLRSIIEDKESEIENKTDTYKNPHIHSTGNVTSAKTTESLKALNDLINSTSLSSPAVKPTLNTLLPVLKTTMENIPSTFVQPSPEVIHVPNKSVHSVIKAIERNQLKPSRSMHDNLSYDNVQPTGIVVKKENPQEQKEMDDLKKRIEVIRKEVAETRIKLFEVKEKNRDIEKQIDEREAAVSV